MAITVTRTIDSGEELRREFQDMGRGDSFTIHGYDALYDLLSDIYEDFELDVIAIDCDYTQNDLEIVLKDYDLESFEELQRNTYAVMLDNGDVLYQNY